MHNLSLVILVFILNSCFGKGDAPVFQSNNNPPTHKQWDELLREHVSKEGWVDYEGFIADSVQLNNYLEMLSNNSPDDDSWTSEEKLAYWLNVYNAFTLKIILDNYPLESIKDISPTIAIPTVNDVFAFDFIPIGDKTLSLNKVEHGIIRGMNEPRIHFAVNCASVSCPKLRNEAYVAEKIDEQLQDQTYYFLNSSGKNSISENKLELSKIFSWYKGDFTEEGTLIEFLNKFAQDEINADAAIDYKDYNWKLNSVENNHLLD